MANGCISTNSLDSTSLQMMQRGIGQQAGISGSGLFGISTGQPTLFSENAGLSQDTFSPEGIMSQGGSEAGFGFGLGLGLGLGLGMSMGMGQTGTDQTGTDQTGLNQAGLNQTNSGVGMGTGVGMTLPASLQGLVGMVPSDTLMLMANTQNLIASVLAGINAFLMQLMQSEAQSQQPGSSSDPTQQAGQQISGSGSTGGNPTTASGTTTNQSTAGGTNTTLDKNWNIPIGKDFKSQADIDAFKAKVIEVAKNIGTDPDNLMAVMNFESGFSSSVRNGSSGATGLIQFMPATARGLGTSTAELAQMSPTQQLEYVAKYFSGGKYARLEDLYTKVFYPAAKGKALDTVVFSSGQSGYSQNKGIDTKYGNGDGQITVAEIAAPVTQIYKKTASLTA